MTLAIGIDLGATKVAGALVNEQGKHWQKRAPSPMPMATSSR